MANLSWRKSNFFFLLQLLLMPEDVKYSHECSFFFLSQTLPKGIGGFPGSRDPIETISMQEIYLFKLFLFHWCFPVPSILQQLPFLFRLKYLRPRIWKLLFSLTIRLVDFLSLFFFKGITFFNYFNLCPFKVL